MLARGIQDNKERAFDMANFEGNIAMIGGEEGMGVMKGKFKLTEDELDSVTGGVWEGGNPNFPEGENNALYGFLEKWDAGQNRWVPVASDGVGYLENWSSTDGGYWMTYNSGAWSWISNSDETKYRFTPKTK